MRFLNVLILLIAALLLTQCNKSYWRQNYRGDISATLNGEEWNPVIIAKTGKNGNLWFLIDVYENERWTESLGISNIPNKEGRYDLQRVANNDRQEANYSIGDQDVVYSYFSVDTTYASNYIKIDNIKSFWNKVEGSFEVRFIKDGTANDPRTDKNTIHIVCDKFSTSIH